MRSHPNPLPPKDVAQRAEYQAATVSVAIGGDCLADIAQLRADQDVFGPVASDPTVSRLVTALAADAGPVVAAINTARAHAGHMHGRRPGTLPQTPTVIGVVCWWWIWMRVC